MSAAMIVRLSVRVAKIATAIRFFIGSSRAQSYYVDEGNCKLPEPLRKYVHDLETRSDPSGDLQMVASLKEQVAALTKKCAELEKELRAARRKRK